MTQLSEAKKGNITAEMITACQDEFISPEELRVNIAGGTAVLPKNKLHNFSNIKAIGKGLRTKVNANLGSSPLDCSIEREKDKLNIAIEAGADSVMDLSTGGDLKMFREMFVANSPVMVGTVPIYGLAAGLIRSQRPIKSMSSDEMFNEIEVQAKSGVDYMTIHCGITRQSIEMLEKSPRLLGMVSRGGTILAKWIRETGKENPFYEKFDTLLDICFEYDITLSLGDGLRPGAIADSTDQAQIEELIILSQLQKRAFNKGVQVIIEGPGHVKLSDIEMNIKLQKSLCNDAPFYVLGPITTDIAPGYDHITSAIGGAVAARAGADFLCYVTPAEHIGLPNLQDVREGVISARIAAHSADICKIPQLQKLDDEMSKARKELDWDAMYELALDPDLLRKRRQLSDIQSDNNVCTMCGDLCAIKLGKVEDKELI
ncbi:MAG: phosphomethylpyrimidine synthase ThiC [Candidatus Cloacimonetes bacterium]|nr:phosphomethylpyrimidine synthase ThiC [Candidatus Cloacimonadota bacterium]